MMQAQLAVFDMIGTTVADGNAVHRSLEAALEAVGIPVINGALNALVKIAKPSAIRLLIECTPGEAANRGNDDYHDNALFTQIHLDYFNRLLTHYQSGPDIREMPGATATFRALREDGVKIALDSGSPRPLVDAILHRLGWADSELIDATVASNEVPLGRPAPDAIFHVMELTRVTEARMVARIGTSPIDLRQGAAAGCGWVIGVGYANAELADAYHTHLIPTIAGVPASLSVRV